MSDATPQARPFRRRVLVNTAATGVGNLWAMVVTLVSLPLLLHGLGADAFGVWVLLQTFSAVTGWFSLADLGVGTATTREVAARAALDDHRGVSRTVSSSLTLFVVLGLACAGLLATLGHRWLPTVFGTPDDLVADLRTAILLFSVQVVLDLLTMGAEAALEGLQRVDLSRAVDAFRRTAAAAAVSVAALAGAGLRGVAVVSLGSAVAGTVLAAAVLRRHLRAPTTSPSGTEMRSLLAYGRTMAVLRPFGVIHRSMDRLVVGVILGPAPVALVEVATQVQNGADAVLSASSYAVIPSASWLRARGDSSRLRELLELGTKYSLLATLPFVVAPALLAGPLVRTWVGSGNGSAAGLAVVALAYVGLTAPVQVGSDLLVGVGNAGAVLRAAALAVAINLVASIVLVLALGTVGAFLGTLVGTAFLVVPLGRSMLRQVDCGIGAFARRSLRPVLGPTVALTALVGAVLLAPLSDVATLVVGTVLGFAGYSAVALRWSMGSGELRGLKQAMAGQPEAASVAVATG